MRGSPSGLPLSTLFPCLVISSTMAPRVWARARAVVRKHKNWGNKLIITIPTYFPAQADISEENFQKFQPNTGKHK